MANNPDPGGTPKAKPDRTPKVSFSEERFTESQPPGRTLEERPQEQQSSLDRIAQEDEDERFFYNLYPELRRSWAAIMAREREHSRSNTSLSASSSPPEEIVLQREMGLYTAINFLLIVSMGTGIYLAPAVVLERAGSVTEALIVWLLSGIFSLLIAITYGELVFLVTQTGERFGYLLAAFSPINSFFGPLPAFLSIWIDGLFLGPAQVSLLALLLAEHLYFPLSSTLKTYANLEVTEPVPVKQLIGMTVIVVITCINFRSMKTCIMIQHVFGVLKMFICLWVIGCGIYSVSKGHTENFNSLFKDMKGNSTGILKAMYQGMWSYEGWNNVVTVSEEMKNPLRTIPFAVLVGLPLVTFLYLTMNMAFLAVLTPKEIKEAATTYILIFEEKLYGSKQYLFMPYFFAISALASAMCIQLGVSRTCFAAAREGHMLEVHSYLNRKRLIPTPALITQALLSLAFILYIPILDLIEYTNFVSWTFYGFAFVALIILRIRIPDAHRLYKTPLCIPIILTTVSVLVTMEPLFRPGEISFYLASTFICFGAIVYYLVVYKQKRISHLDRINKFVRKVLNVAPPTALPEGYSHTIVRTKTVAEILHRRKRYYSNTSI